MIAVITGIKLVKILVFAIPIERNALTYKMKANDEQKTANIST